MMRNSVLAVLIGVAGMVAATAASATEFRGHAGCDRAIDGAQKAWDLAQAAAFLPSNAPGRSAKWASAMGYNDACYDVARALCGSGGGFLRPPASADSVGRCQAILNDTHSAKAPPARQIKTAVNLGGGVWHVAINVPLGYDGSDDTVVAFRCLNNEDDITACVAKDTNGPGTPLFVRATGRTVDEVQTPALRCRTHNRADFSDTTIGEIRSQIANTGNRDDSVMKCEFYALESFKVYIVPSGADMPPNVPAPVAE